MKIVKRNKDTQYPTLGHLMLSDCWDRTFEFEGHTYAVIAKGDSQCTTLTTRYGTLACFNLHSRTIRGICPSKQVRPLYTEIHVNNE